MSIESVLKDLDVGNFKIIGNRIIMDVDFENGITPKIKSSLESLGLEIYITGGLKTSYLPSNLVSVGRLSLKPLQNITLRKFSTKDLDITGKAFNGSISLGSATIESALINSIKLLNTRIHGLNVFHTISSVLDKVTLNNFSKVKLYEGSYSESWF